MFKIKNVGNNPTFYSYSGTYTGDKIFATDLDGTLTRKARY